MLIPVVKVECTQALFSGISGMIRNLTEAEGFFHRVMNCAGKDLKQKNT